MGEGESKRQTHEESQREEDVRERPPVKLGVTAPVVEAGHWGSYDCGERLETEALKVWVLYRCSGCSV